ncbi:MAG: type II secretion system F family protein, partial [bacterium]
MNLEEVRDFYTQLADLLDSGISLQEALRKISLGPGLVSRGWVESAREKLSEGGIREQFREGLNIPERDAIIIERGVNSGEAPELLRSLATLYKHWDSSMSKLLMTFGYLAAVWGLTSFVAGIGVYLLTFSLYASGAVCVISFVTGTAVIVYGYRSFKHLILGDVDPVFYKLMKTLPFFANMVEHIELYLLYSQWELTYRSGVKLPTIFRGINEARYEPLEELSWAANKMEQGTSIGDLTMLKSLFPDEDFARISTGDTSGNLDETLSELASSHRRKMERAVEKLPAVIYAIGMLILVPLVLFVIYYAYSSYFSLLLSLP